MGAKDIKSEEKSRKKLQIDCKNFQKFLTTQFPSIRGTQKKHSFCFIKYDYAIIIIFVATIIVDSNKQKYGKLLNQQH